MTGKLFLDLGDDYAFDPRRAKKAAEGGSGSGGGGGGGTLPPGGVDGPNDSVHGAPYWLQRSVGQGTQWYIWWDIDADPDPDVRRRLDQFLADDNVDQAYRDDVEARATALGYTG